MHEVPNNETRIRILDAADELFSKRGYSSVTLRDIASEVGMKHASLYYYFPPKTGKAALYLEVMERTFIRHREGLTQMIAEAGDDLRQQMYAVARWFVRQPPVDFARMAQADMHAIYEANPQKAAQLMQLAFDALRIPIVEALNQAQAAGIVDLADPDVAAMALVSLVQSVHNIPESNDLERESVSRQLTDMLLYGWLKR